MLNIMAWVLLILRDLGYVEVSSSFILILFVSHVAFKKLDRIEKRLGEDDEI